MKKKKVIPSLKVIHIALVFSLVIFGAVSYFYGVGFVTDFEVTSDIFIYLVPIAAILGYFGSQMIYKKTLKTINRNDKLTRKLTQYQKALILKYAFIVAPAVLAFVIFMRFGYVLYFNIAVLLVIYLAIQTPTRDKVVKDLALSSKEQKKIY
jgi:membrane protein insertase Oxa1/YidC/SpoIIIJ